MNGVLSAPEGVFTGGDLQGCSIEINFIIQVVAFTCMMNCVWHALRRYTHLNHHVLKEEDIEK